MNINQIRILGQQRNPTTYQDDQQQQFDDRDQIQKMRLNLKKQYFKKRKIMVDTLVQMLQQNKRSSTQAKNLRLSDDIEEQRQNVFVIKQVYKRKQKYLQQNQEDDLGLIDEPFNKIKERILTKYKVKRKYKQEMKKLSQEDTLQVQKRVIQQIYKSRFTNPYINAAGGNNLQFQQGSINMNTNTNMDRQISKRSIIQQQQQSNYFNKARSMQQSQVFNGRSSIKKNIQESIRNRSPAPSSPANKQMQQSIVIHTQKNPNTANYMKIDDPNFETYSYQTGRGGNPTAHRILNQQYATKQNERSKNYIFLNRDTSKHLNNSFQESGYKNFLQEQKKQLQEQKVRMIKLTKQANKAISNENLTDSSEQQSHDGNESHYFGTNRNMLQDDYITGVTHQNLNESNKLSTSIDHPTKQVNQVKYLINQLVQLFIMSEILKHQLHYRTYQILNKLYSHASKYYNQTIELEQPLQANNFVIIIKAVLSQENQLRTQIDIVVNKLFQGKNQLMFDQLFKKFQSILNNKEVKLLQPIQMKNEVDKTMDKIHRLFIVWIEMSYFTKKIKELLRRKHFIVTSIMKECSTYYDSDQFDHGLLFQFFCLNHTSNVQKIKFDIFFRHLLGNQLRKRNFIQWYSNDDVVKVSRYQRIGARIDKQKGNKSSNKY